MISFEKTDLQRFLVSVIGALAVSTTCIAAAVGPAKAASPAPVVAQVHQLVVK